MRRKLRLLNKMAKFGAQKGDTVRISGGSNRGEHGEKVSGGKFDRRSATVTKVFSHGVRTNKGYVHNNNIQSKD